MDPAVRGALALAMVALVAALLTGWYAWRSRPSPVALPAVPVETAAVATHRAPARGSASPPGEVVVDVAGRVRRPGVVRLPVGARIVDALARAGGVLPGTDTTGLPLARKLVDGEQVLVNGRPATSAASTNGGPGASSGGAGSPTPVDLNSATVEQLDALPGVGPVLARRIVAWRDEHGGFTSVEQLREVQGVGDKKAADILPLVRV